MERELGGPGVHHDVYRLRRVLIYHRLFIRCRLDQNTLKFYYPRVAGDARDTRYQLVHSSYFQTYYSVIVPNTYKYRREKEYCVIGTSGWREDYCGRVKPIVLHELIVPELG